MRVGQAVYSTGSLFNHSCQPNIHAYFLARMLLIRSTEFVPAWHPLELSYGPQVILQILSATNISTTTSIPSLFSMLWMNFYRWIQHASIYSASPVKNFLAGWAIGSSGQTEFT